MAAAAAHSTPQASPAQPGINIDTDQVLTMMRKKSKDLVGSLLYENAVLETALEQTNSQLQEATAQRDALAQAYQELAQQTAEAATRS